MAGISIPLYVDVDSLIAAASELQRLSSLNLDLDSEGQGEIASVFALEVLNEPAYFFRYAIVCDVDPIARQTNEIRISVKPSKFLRGLISRLQASELFALQRHGDHVSRMK